MSLRRATRLLEARPLRSPSLQRLPVPRGVRSWTVRRLAAVGVGGPAALTVGWALASLRHRPRGRDVVAGMSYREAAPAPGSAAPSRTPVVLVHGLGLSSRSLATLVRALGDTTRTLAPDLPGYGRSPTPRGGVLDVPELAEALLGWMDERGVDDAVLVGHSLGAQVVAEVAIRSRSRVRRLVLVSPSGDPDRPSVLGQALRLLLGVTNEPPRLVGIAVLDYLRAGPGQMLVLMQRALDRAPRQLDARTDVPLLVVRGGEDHVVSQAWCERLADLAGDGRLVVLPGAPHGLTFDPPARLVELLRAEVRAADGDATADG